MKKMREYCTTRKRRGNFVVSIIIIVIENVCCEKIAGQLDLNVECTRLALPRLREN